MFLKKLAAAAAMSALPIVAGAATVDISVDGVGGFRPNSQPGEVTFTITYEPFMGGINNPGCEPSGGACADSLVIDLQSDPTETNAAFGPSFTYIGTAPYDADEYVLSLSDDGSELFVDFLGTSFDPGNQLIFSAAVTGLGGNGGADFGARSVGALLTFNDGFTSSGTFMTDGETSSSVSLAAVPLPAGGALLLLGLAGLGLARRRAA